MDNCNNHIECKYKISEFYIHCLECNEYIYFDNLNKITHNKICYSCINSNIEFIRYCLYCEEKKILLHCKQCDNKKILNNDNICTSCVNSKFTYYI